jgi:tetratricopeptide (TPR) repeat protein
MRLASPGEITMKQNRFSPEVLLSQGATRRSIAISLLFVFAVSCSYAQQRETAAEHYSRGDALFAKDDVSGAVAEYEASLRLNPNSTKALNSLASIYAEAEDTKLRNPAKSLKYALQAVALDHAKNATYLGTLAEAYAINGDYQNAIVTIQNALALQPDESTKRHFEVNLEYYELQTVPADSAAFVPYCADHFDLCRLTVVDVNNINMMKQMGGSHGCTFPRPGTSGRAAYHAKSIEATKAILDWQKANSASLAPKRDDAIEQAMTALWPSECAH